MLPIDEKLPDILRAFEERAVLVLEAPPGAGKTTRLPPALLDQVPGEIVVLEPRRLAARLAATRIASELGCELGGLVGYTVRYENKSSPSTRIRFVTEGVLTRRLIGDPELRGVSAVLLDEFHERHVQGDLALALLKRLRQRRPELRLGVLSATLDGARVAQFLGDAPVVRSEGRAHPIEVRHVEEVDERPLELRVVSAVRELLRQGLRGHVLVFLPGAREITKAQQALGRLAAEHELAVLPLYGEQAPEEQDRALQPSSRRKIILSTNVAESSVTLEGVVAVIDSGLVRRARFDPWSQLQELVLGPCSRASAVQRAGRAGRTGPGTVIRLYSSRDFSLRPEFEEPEMLRADLASVELELAVSGAPDLELLDAPADNLRRIARELLVRLQLLDGEGAPTALGREVAALPLPPRLGRFLCEAKARGVLGRACLWAALLSERDPRRRESFESRRSFGGLDAPPEDSDLDLLARQVELGDRSLERQAVAKIRRAERALFSQLSRRGSRPEDDEGHPSELDCALTVAFADRVARRKAHGSRELSMVGGFVCELAEESLVRTAPLLLCLRGDKRKRPLIRMAHRVDAELLALLFSDAIEERTSSRFDANSGRVLTRAETLYQGVLLDEAPAPPGAEAAELLVAAVLARGVHTLFEDDALERWRGRCERVAAIDPRVQAPDAPAIEAALRELAAGASKLAELDGASLLALVQAGTLGRELVEQQAPEQLLLPSGRRARVHYAPGQSPWLESFLQDFCGLRETPSVAGERLVLHLLAPNRRAVQVTQDLPSFWSTHYPKLRPALSRRYPRHAWPTDPSQPVPAKHR